MHLHVLRPLVQFIRLSISLASLAYNLYLYTCAIPHILYQLLHRPSLHSSILFKQLGLNGRKIYIAGLVMSAVGGLLMGDWQATGRDPCREEFTERQLNQSWIGRDGSDLSVRNTSTALEIKLGLDETHKMELDKIMCEQLSTEANVCFWNPYSRVTGQYCSECFKVCRSVHKSLNFVQLALGMGLFFGTVPLLTVTVLVIASDVMPLEQQVCGLYKSGSV